MKILVVKLSSLGDVVHTMPAVQDIRSALPHARVDWVVERAFAPLVRRCRGVARVIACDLRAWRVAPLSAGTRGQWRSFRAELRAEGYDAVIDLQGLTKSALVSRMACVTANGHRYALGNRTDGAGWELPTRWLADRPIRIAPRTHAVQRSRELCALALGYEVPPSLEYGLAQRFQPRSDAMKTVALLHGSSRRDKQWPLASWQETGRRLLADGWRVALAHGDADEQARSSAIAEALHAQGDSSRVECWPQLTIDALADRLSACGGAIGVDSGPSHLAVALGLPHVQIYRHATAWRTGPLDHARQCSVEDAAGPSVDAVWDAWRRVGAEAPRPS